MKRIIKIPVPFDTFQLNVDGAYGDRDIALGFIYTYGKYTNTKTWARYI